MVLTKKSPQPANRLSIADRIKRILKQPFSPKEQATIAPLHSTELLTVDEEKLLFLRLIEVRNLVAKAKKAEVKSVLLEKLEMLGHSIRNRIVQANTRLVIGLARKRTNSWISYEDLLSEAYASLIHAVDRFDIRRGYKFSTYATRAVMNNLNHFVNRSHRINRWMVNGVSESFDMVADTDDVGPASNSRMQQVNAISELVNQLDDETKCVLQVRFGLDQPAEVTNTRKKRKGKSLRATSQSLGLSRDRIRLVQAGALAKLRRLAEQHQSLRELAEEWSDES